MKITSIILFVSLLFSCANSDLKADNALYSSQEYVAKTLLDTRRYLTDDLLGLLKSEKNTLFEVIDDGYIRKASLLKERYLNIAGVLIKSEQLMKGHENCDFFGMSVTIGSIEGVLEYFANHKEDRIIDDIYENKYNYLIHNSIELEKQLNEC